MGVVAQYWDDGFLARFGRYSRGIPTGQLLFFAPKGPLTKRIFFSSKKPYHGGTHFRFVCVAAQGTKMRCKTIDDIRHDLGTIVSADKVEEFLAQVDSLAYQGLGLDETADALIGCADGRVTAKPSGQALLTASAGNPKAHGFNGSTFTASIFGDVSAQQRGAGLRNLAASSCGGLSASAGSGVGIPGVDPYDRAAVDQAVQEMDEQCKKASKAVLPPVPAPALVAEAIGYLTTAFKWYGHIQTVKNVVDAVMDDGYSESGRECGPGCTEYAEKGGGTGYKQEREGETTYFWETHTEDGSVVKHSRVLDTNYDVSECKKADDGCTIAVETQTTNGKVTKTIEERIDCSSHLADGCKETVTTTHHGDGLTTVDTTWKEASGETTTNTKNVDGDGHVTTPPPSGGGVGMPNPDADQRSTCQQWEDFKAMCEQVQ